jgi:outer membrane protein
MPTARDVLRSISPAAFIRCTCATLALTAVALIPQPAHAAGEPLTLNRAIERAVAGNPDLRRERVNIETAAGRLESARGFFDLNLTSDFIASSKKTPSLTTRDLQGGASNALELDIGVQRQLETGGNISLSISNARTNSGAALSCGTVEGVPGECRVYDSSVGLRFTQPLLRGLGPEFALANVRRNRILTDQALLNRLTRASSVLRDVINTYWGLAYQTQDLAIRNSAVDLAREQLRVTKAQIDVGRLAPVDAAAVERAIGDRQQDVLLSQQDLLFRTLELRRFFGLVISPTDPPFTAADAPEASPHPLNIAADINRALEANPQLRSLKLGIALTEVDIATARSTLRPQLDFTGTIGAAGRNLGIGFQDSLKQVAGVDNLAWTAGLHFSLPVQNRAAGGQEHVAVWAGNRAQLEAADFDQEIRFQVMELSSNIDTAAKRLELAKATVGFANQNLEAEKARFSVGRSTNNEVLRLQQELKNAEIQVLRATVDLLIGQTNLSALTGDLLQTYQVTLKGLQ